MDADQEKKGGLIINPGIYRRRRAKGWIPHGNGEDPDKQDREQDNQKLYARIGSRYDPKMRNWACLETWKKQTKQLGSYKVVKLWHEWHTCKQMP